VGLHCEGSDENRQVILGLTLLVDSLLLRLNADRRQSQQEDGYDYVLQLIPLQFKFSPFVLFSFSILTLSSDQSGIARNE